MFMKLKSCIIKSFTELVDETKTAKEDAESRVQLLESDLKKMKSDAFHSKEDAKKSGELLVQAKEKIEATNKTVETLLKELNNVQGQLKLSRDEVNNMHQALNRERMKSSATVTQTLQSSGDNVEMLNLMSQVENLTRELASIKNDQSNIQTAEDETDDGPKTLVFKGHSKLSEHEVILIVHL